MAFRGKASRKFVPVVFGLRFFAALLLAAGVAGVAVDLANGKAGTKEVAFFFLGAVVFGALIGLSLLWMRRRMTGPMTPLPHDARVLSRREVARRYFLWLSLALAAAIAIANPNSKQLALFAGAYIACAAIYLWQAHWIARAELTRGELWFGERRFTLRTRKPPYFARATR
jgi:hypothetical protein